MSRKASPLVPRKTSISGEVRWEVRVPIELRQAESVARRRFAKEGEAKGYCNRLKADLLQYSDKARGLTDKQKIEAQECFTKLQAYPGATLTHAVDLLIERLTRDGKSFAVSELAGRVIADDVTSLFWTG